MHKFILRPKSIAESALDGHFSEAQRPSHTNELNSFVDETRAAPKSIVGVEPTQLESGLSSRNLEFSTEEDTLKNSLREAVWGPSLLLLALGAVTFGGCRAKTSFSDAELPSTNSVLDSPTTTTALEVTARTTQAKFKAGQDVPLEIRVKNASDVPVKMNFTSGQSFDFQAFKPGDSEAAWTWSADKNFLQAQRSQTLAPGQELKFSETWANVPKGRYNVVASLSANGGLRASAFEIVVE